RSAGRDERTTSGTALRASREQRGQRRAVRIRSWTMHRSFGGQSGQRTFGPSTTSPSTNSYPSHVEHVSTGAITIVYVPPQIGPRPTRRTERREPAHRQRRRSLRSRAWSRCLQRQCRGRVVLIEVPAEVEVGRKNEDRSRQQLARDRPVPGRVLRVPALAHRDSVPEIHRRRGQAELTELRFCYGVMSLHGPRADATLSGADDAGSEIATPDRRIDQLRPRSPAQLQPRSLQRLVRPDPRLPPQRRPLHAANLRSERFRLARSRSVRRVSSWSIVHRSVRKYRRHSNSRRSPTTGAMTASCLSSSR